MVAPATEKGGRVLNCQSVTTSGLEPWLSVVSGLPVERRKRATTGGCAAVPERVQDAYPSRLYGVGMYRAQTGASCGMIRGTFSGDRHAVASKKKITPKAASGWHRLQAGWSLPPGPSRYSRPTAATPRPPAGAARLQPVWDVSGSGRWRSAMGPPERLRASGDGPGVPSPGPEATSVPVKHAWRRRLLGTRSAELSGDMGWA